MGDVSLANMETPENGSVYLRFWSADNYTSKVNEFVRETSPNYHKIRDLRNVGE